MAEDNPFAPSAVTAQTRPVVATARAVDLDAARAALARHTQDTAALAADRAARGARLRVGALAAAGFGALGILAAIAVGVGVGGEDGFVIGLLLGLVGFVFVLVGGILVFTDLRLVDRAEPHTVEEAAKTYWRTIAMRPGVAWSSLAPTARAARVSVPEVPPVPTPLGDYALHDWKAFRDWGRTFAINGHGQTRGCQWKSTEFVRQEGDYAETRTTVRITALPQWAMITSVVAFVLIRLVGLILFAVFHFTVRKNADVVVEQKWLQGADGAWYLLDPAIVAS